MATYKIIETMNLTNEQLRDVLQRAEEIQTRTLVDTGTTESLEPLLSAAEEAGVPRDAMLQALKERVNLLENSYLVGDRCFAQSADGKFYAAEITEAHGSVFKVRFISGSTAQMSREQLKPFSLMPGQKVNANWPSWGWHTCTVQTFDPHNLMVKLGDGWGQEHNFALSEIRLLPDRASWELAALHSKIFIAAAALVSGCGLGALVTWLFMR